MEISKVYLYSKAPLTPEQEAEALRDIATQAKGGFRVEIQREVLAHGAEETYSFLVRRIEPANKFYGSVDGGTAFEIVRDDKPPPPTCESLVKDPDAIEKVSKLADELFSEVGKMKTFMDELEAVRVKHGVSWGCLRKVVEAIDQFGDETTPTL